jgi:hypothetical protein
MSVAELMPTLQNLLREDKLQVLQFLLSDLTQQAGVDLLQSGVSYPIWTPLDAYDAARSLQQLLEQGDKRGQRTFPGAAFEPT